MMRILLVSDFYPPSLGGAERQVQLLGQLLAQRDHQVIVATIWQEGLPEQENDGGIIVHRLRALATQVPWFSGDSGHRFHPPFPDPFVIRGLHRLVCDIEPDLVHTSGWISYSCAIALRQQKIPLIISVRDYGYSCPIRTLIFGNRACTGPHLLKCLRCAKNSYGMPKAIAAVGGVFAGKAILRHRVDGVHFISSFVQQIIKRDLYRPKKAVLQSYRRHVSEVIIPSFLGETNAEKLLGTSLVSDSLKHLPDEPYLLFVGALQLHKGLQVLLSAYRLLQSPPPLVIIGNKWPDSPTSFPPEIVVLHDVPHKDVMTAWKRSLFGVAPSLWPEPLGAVVFEAMSQGKAIIGTVPGGHADLIIDGETGLLVPSGDVEALAGAMKCLIQDKDLRENMGRAAQERSKLFCERAVIPQFEAFYSSFIATK